MISIDREMLWQWDYGQRVQLHDVPVGTAVHFSNAAIKPNALKKEAYEDGEGVYADIPNVLLQTAGTLTVYIYIEDGDEGHTEYRKLFIVRDRERPDDYVYTEDDVKTWEMLEERIKVLEESGGGAADGLIRPLSTIGEIVGVTVEHVPDKDRVELTVEMTADSMNSVFGGNAVYKNDYLNARQLQLMFRIPGAGRLFLWELFEDDLVTVTNYPNKKFIMVSTNRMIVSLTYDENGQFVSETKTYQANVQKVEEMISEAVAGLPQSDWNQSDETAPDYVKNRTHYEKIEKVLTDTVTCTAEYERPTGTYSCNLSGSAYYLQYKGDNGDTVYVVVDGVEYVCKQRGSLNSAETAYGYAIGNTALLEGDSFSDGFGNLEFEDTGEPFVFWVHNYYTPGTSIIFREQGEHTAEIRKNTIATYPLDEKYIPESIARKSDIPQGGGTSDIPDTLPNPHPLTFTGAVEATYDGSTPVTVEIPMGGGGGYKWELIEEITLSENVASVKIDLPLEYSAFSIVFRGTLVTETNTTLDMRFNNDTDQRPQFADLQYRRERPTEIKIERRGTMYPIVTRAVNGGARTVNVQEYVADIDWKAWNEFTFVTCCATNNEFASGYEITVFGVRA